MRLYRLLSRHGKRKQRVYPWFDAPAAGAPMKYEGWVWDPAIREWVESEVDPITIRIEPEREPKPDWIPRSRQPAKVAGWFWSDSMKKWVKDAYFRAGHYGLEPYPPMPDWVPSRMLPAEADGWYYDFGSNTWEKTEWQPATIWISDPWPPMPEQVPGPELPSETASWVWSDEFKDWMEIIRPVAVEEFVPPRSLPPGLTQKALFEQFSWEALYLEEVRYFLGQGYTTEAANQITRQNFDPLIRMMYAKEKAAAVTGWTDLVAALSRQETIVIKELTVYAVVIIVVAVVAYMVGYILSHIAAPHEEEFIINEPPGTYLLGPDNWSYSRDIGSSKTGALLFSSCDDIGTEFVRHKRGPVGGLYDILDFPGGFIEDGYQFPYWVKYTWYYWLIIYIGMLYTASAEHYALKKELISLKERAIRVKIRPYEEWCEGFHWYL